MDRDELVAFVAQGQLAGLRLTDEEVAGTADRMLLVGGSPPAELEEQGYRHLTVEHGTIAYEEEGPLRHLYDWERANPGAVASWGGPMHATTFVLAPPHAERHLAELETVAREHDPGTWQIRRGPR